MTATETVRPARHAPHAAMVAARPTPTQVVGLLGEVAATRRHLDGVLGAPDVAEVAHLVVQSSTAGIDHARHHDQPAELRAELVRLAAIALAWADTIDPHTPGPAPSGAGAGAGAGGPGAAGDFVEAGGVPEFCEASGWPVRTGCVDHHGRAHCPLCGRRVPAGPAGPRVVVLDLHEAARP